MQNKCLCPVCGSLEYVRLFPEYKGIGISSDWHIHSSIEIHNACCKGCGLIYEGCGVRSFSHDFYSTVFKPKPMMKVFGKSSSRSRQEIAYDYLSKELKLGKTGKLLEAGAGIGGFSKIFASSNSGWHIDSFEPSASYEHLSDKAKALGNLKVKRAAYTDYDVKGGNYDLIVSLGVLEHVENPYHMLEWASEGLKDGGHLFLEVPNFSHQPSDLLCIDHLSKLNRSMVENYAMSAGLVLVNYKEEGVPLYLWFRKDLNKKLPFKNLFEESYRLAVENERVLKSSLNAIDRARKAAQSKGEAFGVFGLATSGLMSPFYFGYDPTEITCFIDENQELWGLEIMGRSVKGLDAIKEYGIKHISLAISPQYIENVKSKLAPYKINVYSPRDD